jgi:hypothetical protein
MHDTVCMQVTRNVCQQGNYFHLISALNQICGTTKSFRDIVLLREGNIKGNCVKSFLLCTKESGLKTSRHPVSVFILVPQVMEKEIM